MSKASVSITLVTAAATVAASVSVFRTVTDAQLRALEQCEPACQVGAPLLFGPWHLVLSALLLVGIILVVMSFAAGWPISSAQMR